MQIDTFGTGKVGDDIIAKAVNDVFNMRPAAIINDLRCAMLLADYSAYGHFGNGYLRGAYRQIQRTEGGWEKYGKDDD